MTTIDIADVLREIEILKYKLQEMQNEIDNLKHTIHWFKKDGIIL